MARIYERYGSSIVAQAVSAVVAGAFSTGAQTVIDKTSGANADGAVWFDCFLDVTVPPTTAATVELYINASPDGVNFSANEYALSCSVSSTVSAGYYHIGTLHDTPQTFKTTFNAVDYGFTGQLIVVPVYPSDS